MIHIHGTPMGGSRQDTAKFLMGRHALVPFTYQDDMPIVAECCQSFVLDNGAFTIWKKGGEMDYRGYLDFVEKWYRHPGFDWALIPDVIDGNEKDNDVFLDMWPNNLKGVPVWHMHESIDRLIRLSDAFEWVALGSSGQWPNPNTPSWWRRMEEILDTICDEHGRPPCKLHGLRMLDPEVFTKIPLSSADSTNAARNNNQLNRFGMYCPPTTAQRSMVIAERIESYNSAAVWVRKNQLQLFENIIT